MPIDKVKFPDDSVENIRDSRIPGIDTTPTANSDNLITSGGVKGALGGYLPLTGGTLTGNLFLTEGSSSIYINGSGSSMIYGTVSKSGTIGNTVFGQGFGNTYLRGQNNPAYRKYDSAGNYQEYTMWHAGNDGAGSGLDADLLDGLEGQHYYKLTVGSRIANGTDINSITTTGNYFIGGNADAATMSNLPLAYAGQLRVYNPIGSANYIMQEFATYEALIYYRNTTNGGSSWSSWKRVAFTSDNVASATKLATPRTIWGQSFDGTGDVNGAMTGVTTVNSFINAERGDSVTAYLFLTNVYASVDYAHIFVSNQDKSATHRPLVLQNGYGNVGVGIPNPSSKLDVNGDGHFASKLNIGSLFSGNSSRATLSVITSSDDPCDLVLGSSAVNKWSITARPSSHNYSLGFYSYVSGGWPLWISHNGNVRIGGSGADATDRLRVDGTISGQSVTTTLQTSQPSGGMLPNMQYALGELSGDTTFSMAAGTSGVTNHYYWTFSTPSTAPTITWPAAITSWFGGSAPTINANKHYEVSVLDGVAICMEV